MTLAVWYLQSLLTPLIAFIALYIAWQQWKTNDLKSRLDRYERRLKVYQEVVKILTLAVQRELKHDDVINFKRETAEADFLFGPEIPKYIDEIFESNVKLWFASTRSAAAYDRDEVVAERHTQLTWLTDQISVAQQKFKKYLAVYK